VNNMLMVRVETWARSPDAAEQALNRGGRHAKQRTNRDHFRPWDHPPDGFRRAEADFEEQLLGPSAFAERCHGDLVEDRLSRGGHHPGDQVGHHRGVE